MSPPSHCRLRILLWEGGENPTTGAPERFAILTALLEKGFAVTRMTDGGGEGAFGDTPLLVLGRFGTAGRESMPGLAGAAQARFLNLEGLGPSNVVRAAEQARAELSAARSGEWQPWFPVIDYDRCTNCMQCLSFCLFDVYGVDAAQKIEVRHSENCKTNCPACSRVCPEAAIIFPKYKAGPINGAEVREADLNREKTKVDVSALLGGDLYSALRERSERRNARFSTERDSQTALEERRKCLSRLTQMGDIPPEVLMSLPSPDEIQRRAQEAAAKARAALEGRSAPTGTATD